jgi:hypothetical protein
MDPTAKPYEVGLLVARWDYYQPLPEPTESWYSRKKLTPVVSWDNIPKGTKLFAYFIEGFHDGNRKFFPTYLYTKSTSDLVIGRYPDSTLSLDLTKAVVRLREIHPACFEREE